MMPINLQHYPAPPIPLVNSPFFTGRGGWEKLICSSSPEFSSKLKIWQIVGDVQVCGQVWSEVTATSYLSQPIGLGRTWQCSYPNDTSCDILLCIQSYYFSSQWTVMPNITACCKTWPLDARGTWLPSYVRVYWAPRNWVSCQHMVTLGGKWHLIA